MIRFRNEISITYYTHTTHSIRTLLLGLKVTFIRTVYGNNLSGKVLRPLKYSKHQNSIHSSIV